MFKNQSEIIDAIILIANALGSLNERVVYIGGAVVGLYVNNKGAPEVRPTKDIDIVIEIASLMDLEKFRKELAKRQIYVARDEEVICRFSYKNILLDVMATKAIGWAPANPWFKYGFDNPEIKNLGQVKIKIMSLPYYLAAKFAAFVDRGTDPRTSKDFEDIVYILDNRHSITEDIIGSDAKVKDFLTEELNKILHDSLLQEAVLAHLEPYTQTERFSLITDRINDIIKGY